MFKRLYLQIFLTVFSAIVILTGCGGGSQIRSVLYAIDFTKGNTQWTAVKTLLDDGFSPQNTIECWISWKGKMHAQLSHQLKTAI